jgi:hypothetical protein
MLAQALEDHIAGLIAGRSGGVSRRSSDFLVAIPAAIRDLVAIPKKKALSQVAC